jgi:GxxExxY protein
MTKEQYEYLANQIFSSSLEVHKNLGPGLLESVYEFAFLKEMELRNISAQYQVKVPLFYKGFETGIDFFIDILVDSKIIIEIKSVDMIHPVHVAQLLSYLKLFDKRLGFLINFTVPLLKDGFKRMVNNYY